MDGGDIKAKAKYIKIYANEKIMETNWKIINIFYLLKIKTILLSINIFKINISYLMMEYYPINSIKREYQIVDLKYLLKDLQNFIMLLLNRN